MWHLWGKVEQMQAMQVDILASYVVLTYAPLYSKVIQVYYIHLRTILIDAVTWANAYKRSLKIHFIIVLCERSERKCIVI